MASPSAPGQGALVLPMFPLPDVTLFPGTLMPLHIFEARYRAMVMDVLARDRRLCIVQLRPGQAAAVHAVGGAGEIVNWERLASGRYNVVVKGEARVRLQREQPADTLYRIAVARRLDDVAPMGDLAAPLARIQAACRRLLRALDRPAHLLDAALTGSQPPGVVADRVASAVLPDGALRQRLLETLDVSERVTLLSGALDDLVRELLEGRENA